MRGGNALTYPAVVLVCIAVTLLVLDTWQAAVGSWLLSNFILFAQAVTK